MWLTLYCATRTRNTVCSGLRRRELCTVNMLRVFFCWARVSGTLYSEVGIFGGQYVERAREIQLLFAATIPVPGCGYAAEATPVTPKRGYRLEPVVSTSSRGSLCRFCAVYCMYTGRRMNYTDKRTCIVATNLPTKCG